MSLPAEVLEEIDVEVRSGFEERDRIIEIFLEEKHEPGELDVTGVTYAVDAAIEAHERQKRAWPDVTDCDKPDVVFDHLNSKGIIALHNAGYTQSDGYSDVLEAYDEHANKQAVIGYCYYHGQDVARAVQGQGLYFAFGPVDERNEATEGPRIGAIVAAELQQAGFTVQWDGTFSERIFIPTFDWKKR